jgi:integrase/recombinase XerC
VPAGVARHRRPPVAIIAEARYNELEYGDSISGIELRASGRSTMDNATATERFERYLQRRYPERSTVKHYLSDLRQFEKMCSKPWSEVTTQDIDAFVDYGQAHGWKPATVRRRVAALKTFFEFYAEEMNMLEQPNPVQPWRQSPKRGQRLPRDVSDEVLEQLWLAVDQPRDQVWFTLMLRGGLRVGEGVSLNRGDILSPATGEESARLRVKGKGRKERIVCLSGDAYGVVARWLALMPRGAESPLCPNARGQRMTVNGVLERLRHYATKAGVTVTCHQLRHTYARQLVEHDLPVTTLSKLLGHACLSTTEVYLTGADPQVRRAYLAAMAEWEEEQTRRAVEQPGETRPAVEEPTGAARAIAVPLPPLTPALATPCADLVETWAPTLPSWVREVCLAYVHELARNWKPSHLRRHSRRRLRALAQFWEWQMARRPIQGWAELTRADVQAYVDKCVAQKRAPSTVKNVLSLVWGALRQRQSQGEEIAESVFQVRLPKDREVAPRHLSETEARQLEGHMQAVLAQETYAAQRDTAWYFVLAHTGIRLNELIDLRRGDVDVAGARLRIDQGKGHRDRIVSLSDMAQRALTRYLAALPPQAAEAPLFYWAEGVPLGYRWVQKRLHELGDAAGVKDVSPHRLRHTFATRLINQGVPIPVIQKLLGHDDLNTTQRYAKVADPTVEREYRQAMTEIEQRAGALSLAPLPLPDVWPVPLAVARDRVTLPLDNSM